MYCQEVWNSNQASGKVLPQMWDEGPATLWGRFVAAGAPIVASASAASAGRLPKEG